MPLHLKIVTPERVVYEDEVDSLTVMTETGEITVLPGHVPLVTALKPGEMRLRHGETESLLAVSTGFLEMRPPNTLVILADTAECVEELELEKIEQAIAEAKARAKALQEQKKMADDRSFADAAAAVERELARYKVALKKYRKPGVHIQETE